MLLTLTLTDSTPRGLSGVSRVTTVNSAEKGKKAVFLSAIQPLLYSIDEQQPLEAYRNCGIRHSQPHRARRRSRRREGGTLGRPPMLAAWAGRWQRGRGHSTTIRGGTSPVVTVPAFVPETPIGPARMEARPIGGLTPDASGGCWRSVHS
jgi:hypothetical protein